MADEDKASLEEDDADRKEKAVCQRTPIKSHWIVPLLLNEIAEKPNMSNAEMKHVGSAYVKEKFITSSLLQNARTMARDEIFRDLATNVFFCQWSVCVSWPPVTRGVTVMRTIPIASDPPQ